MARAATHAMEEARMEGTPLARQHVTQAEVALAAGDSAGYTLAEA